MTREERKRAIALEKTMGIYAKSFSAGLMMAICYPLLIIMDILLIKLCFDEGELFNFSAIMFANVFFLMIISVVTSDTSMIGDVISYDQNAALAVGGTMHTGKLMCTLPFKAKDILNLRIINFEKQLCMYFALTAAMQTVMLIAGGMGYQTYDGIMGIGIVVSMFVEIVLLVLKLFRFKFYTYMMLGFVGGILSLIISDFFPGTAEEAVEFNARISVERFSVVSGVSGIIIVLVFAFLLAAAGELYLKRKNNVSWNLY